MLSKELKNRWYLYKKVNGTVHVNIEYELTKLGHAFQKVLDAIF